MVGFSMHLVLGIETSRASKTWAKVRRTLYHQCFGLAHGHCFSAARVHRRFHGDIYWILLGYMGCKTNNGIVVWACLKMGPNAVPIQMAISMSRMRILIHGNRGVPCGTTWYHFFWQNPKADLFFTKHFHPGSVRIRAAKCQELHHRCAGSSRII